MIKYNCEIKEKKETYRFHQNIKQEKTNEHPKMGVFGINKNR
jgi:hypothetical protein